MNKKRFFAVILLFFFAALINGFSQTPDGKEIMKSGLEKYTKAEYSGAILDFRGILLNPAYENFYDAAYFWIARCYMESGQLSKAETNLEFFIKNFPHSRFYPESLYQKGRLLYLQHDYENSIRAFYYYLKNYPGAPFTADSYFWIAESLYSLGHFKEALQLYTYVITKYPASYKARAARYKRSLVLLKQHEEELLKLLRLSHEEYLKMIADFQNREKMYEQALAGYQRKLIAASNNDTKKLLEELNSELAKKDQEIAALHRKLMEKNTKDKINNSGQKSVPPEGKAAAIFSRLLELKSEALDLKAFYLDWLKSNSGE